MINKVIDIADSWLALLNPTDAEKIEAKRRKEICNACSHKTMLDICGHCGCPLASKVYSKLSLCPLGKWE